MKPKQNNKNNKNKGAGNNNKRLKQLQQQQQQLEDQQPQASVSGEVKTSRTDDVEALETADVMTSSVVDCSAETTQNIERQNIPAEYYYSDNQSLDHSPQGDTDHVTDRCADDVISDVEVADILHAAPAVNPDVMTPDPGVTEVMTSDPGNREVITELIMSKTFTESTHPGREFVPIRRDTDDVTVNPLPVEWTLKVGCELVSGGGGGVMTSSCHVRSARGQLKDLTSEFRHLQSLLDDVTSAGTCTDHVDTSSSEEEVGEDWRQSRVVYHYHLRHQGPPTTRRWIRRDDVTRPEELDTPTDLKDVVGEQYQETCLERGSQGGKELNTQWEQSTVKEDKT